MSPNRTQSHFPQLPVRNQECRNHTLKSQMENEPEAITALLLCTIIGVQDILQGMTMNNVLPKMQSIAARLNIKLDIEKMLEIIAQIKNKTDATENKMETVEASRDSAKSDEDIDVEKTAPPTSSNHE